MPDCDVTPRVPKRGLRPTYDVGIVLKKKLKNYRETRKYEYNLPGRGYIRLNLILRTDLECASGTRATKMARAARTQSNLMVNSGTCNK